MRERRTKGDKEEAGARARAQPPLDHTPCSRRGCGPIARETSCCIEATRGAARLKGKGSMGFAPLSAAML